MADADPKIDPKAATDTVVISPPPGTLTETPVKRRTWLRPLLMVSLPLLIIAIAGYFWLTAGRFVSTDNAYIQQDKVSVSSDVGGRIVRVDARENQPVKAGDLLFQIDPDPYRIALAQANAAIATARVQVSTLATDSGGAAADISSAKADIALAQATYDRQAALMKQGFTTRASFDAAAQQVAAAKARLATANASAAKARTQVGSGTDGSGVPAAVQAAMVQRDKAALDLRRTSVYAPVSGTISQSDRLQVGQMMIVGLPAVSIVSNHPAWVEANFKETELNKMCVGQPSEVEFDAYNGLKLKGHVQSIGAGTGSEFSVLPAQNATGNWVKVTQRVPVRIAIDQASKRPLIAGLSANVTVDVRSGHC